MKSQEWRRIKNRELQEMYNEKDVVETVKEGCDGLDMRWGVWTSY